ncbi:hypothetical protein QC762_310335 [Podospora pseudocomata]|uniref:C2H2-type domain-containing protein n=2 Tax=Podospora TaxID=5144 RepID=A0ABY6S7P2_PODCO|nr:hypothetical protein QC762_310335 [Podospora pseudocomata]VBB78377.1 Putative protein of unknown function [Podospora comata]
MNMMSIYFLITYLVLRKQSRSLNPKFQCPVCAINCGETRARNRHIWAEHSEYAKENDIPSEQEACPFPGCRYRGRKDNVPRHYKTQHSQ